MRPGTLSPGLTPLKENFLRSALRLPSWSPRPILTKETPPPTSSLLNNLCPTTIETHPVPSGPSGRVRYEILQQKKTHSCASTPHGRVLKINKSHATNETHTCPLNPMVVYVMKSFDKQNPLLRLRAPWSCTKENTSAGHYAHQLPGDRRSSVSPPGSSAWLVCIGMSFPLPLRVFKGFWA